MSAPRLATQELAIPSLPPREAQEGERVRLRIAPTLYAARLMGLMADMSGFSPEELRVRWSRTVTPWRMTAYAVMRRAGYSLSEIGEAFDRHHTVVHRGIVNGPVDEEMVDVLAAKMERYGFDLGNRTQARLVDEIRSGRAQLVEPPCTTSASTTSGTCVWCTTDAGARS